MKVDGSLGGGGALIHMLMPFMCLVVESVADISGSEKVLTSGSIRLTSSPIFVEIIE